MIRSRANNSDFDPVLGVPLQCSIRDFVSQNRWRGKAYTGVTIENIHVIPCIQVIYSTFTVDLKSVWSSVRVIQLYVKREIHAFVHLDIHRAPPDVILRSFLVDNTLILGTPAGLLTGEVDKGTRGRDDSTLVADSILVEERDWSVAFQIDLVHIKTSLGVEIEVLSDNCGDYQKEVWGGYIGLLTTANCLIVERLGIVLVEDVGGNVGGLVEDHLLRRGEKAS